jgi:hypothetical protein
MGDRRQHHFPFQGHWLSLGNGAYQLNSEVSIWVRSIFFMSQILMRDLIYKSRSNLGSYYCLDLLH